MTLREPVDLPRPRCGKCGKFNSPWARIDGFRPKDVCDCRQHVIEGLDCWCNPTYCMPCGECENGCWRCKSGSIDLTRAEADASDSPVVVVHNFTDTSR